MCDVNIVDPNAVIDAVQQMSSQFDAYLNEIYGEQSHLNEVFGYIEAAQQAIQRKEESMTDEFERAQRQCQNSDGTYAPDFQEALERIRKKREALSEIRAAIDKCREQLSSMMQDLHTLRSDLEEIQGEGSVLAGKVDQFVHKIMDAR